MFRIEIIVKKNGKKVKINVCAVSHVEINQTDRGSGKGDMWVYLHENSGEKILCHCIKASYKPVIVEAAMSTLGFNRTDDIFTDYTV